MQHMESIAPSMPVNHTTSKAQQNEQAQLADQAFSDYDFGDNVTVTDTGGWESSNNSLERTLKVYIEPLNDEDPSLDRLVLTFTVRFNQNDNSLAEVYAIDDDGAIWGLPKRLDSQPAPTKPAQEYDVALSPLYDGPRSPLYVVYNDDIGQSVTWYNTPEGLLEGSFGPDVIVFTVHAPSYGDYDYHDAIVNQLVLHDRFKTHPSCRVFPQEAIDHLVQAQQLVRTALKLHNQNATLTTR